MHKIHVNGNIAKDYNNSISIMIQIQKIKRKNYDLKTTDEKNSDFQEANPVCL